MGETLDSIKSQVMLEAEALLDISAAYREIRYAIPLKDQFLVIAQLKGILNDEIPITQTHYWAQALYKYFAKKKSA